ncbi:mechanosensitive ion channel family protein [Actomonas aquatica]|uniref:Mechanosensitive ion channel n=1 Tax=Actomonas aquatica TaxID=2866162 RepID=A0ABZ1C9G6_9BACT|nr:mechanosensitive ion channel domain-containing protein [Opitutus sp. WL0086]WRQ87863.1 mechanosensitive ion channel [Opitutus sp. WL0086]
MPLPLASVTDLLAALGPLVATAAICGIVLRIAHWLLLGRFPNLGNERRLPRQLIMVFLALVAIALLALALPVSDSSRNQVLGLIGLIISGMFAFSSTTILANLTAGMMLRITKPFRTGDFIRVEDHFGRVSERGLLDTEVQTEHRDLIAFPHTFLITHPVTTIRASGTIVSTSLSLGYDVHHATIDGLLKQAASDAGLTDPFVQVSELGDYAVTYRVAGLLTEVKSLLTTRSILNRHVLDALHGAGIEIASPAIMNQRRIPEEQPIMPSAATPVSSSTQPEPPTAETLAFDKAEEAEAAEIRLAEIEAEIKRLEADPRATGKDAAPALAAKIQRLQEERESLLRKHDDHESTSS